MKKRLTLFSLLLLFTMTAMAIAKVDGIYYNLNSSDNTAEVTRKPDGTYYLDDIVIPASISVYGVDYSVTSIGDDAFEHCFGLTSIEIPNSVTSIGGSAFRYCSGLTSIEIPNSVTEIGESAFDGCSSLTSIEIPNSVTSIESCVFSSCSSLTSIEIPNSVTSIESCVFSGCSDLTSIEIPKSVIFIGYGAFSGCSGLTSIVVEEGNSCYDSRENCNAIIETASNKLIAGCQNTVIPNSVTEIESAFSGCSGLTSIEIPNSVTSIGNHAFEHCSGLTSIEIPNSVTLIGIDAFRCCFGLTSIEIPNSVTEIGSYAFYWCSGLTSITMQRATPPTVGDHLFSECRKLETIYVPVGASEAYNVAPWNWCNIVEQEIINPMRVYGLYYNVDVENKTAEVVAAPNDTKYSGDIVIPASISVYGVDYSVTSIGSGAFEYCSSLTSIDIPTSVTSIGKNAFEGCSGLTSIDIPNSVTSIGSYAFEGCSGLTSIEIPNSVTSIGSYAFSWCSGLTSIEIPNSVTTIRSYAFIGCSSLTGIVVEEGNSYYDSREKCNAIIETSSNKLLAGCQNTVIPTSVTSIGERAFSGCSGLTSIEIPISVTSIGSYAFSGCSSLTSITMQRATPPTVGSSGLFSGCSKLETIYVPVGASEAYNVAPWNKYKIVEREVAGIESVTLEEWPADVYDLNGRMVKAQAESLDGLPKGVYIVNGKKFVK